MAAAIGDGAAPPAPGWDRAALGASPFHAALWPLLPELPADRFPTLDELTALAGARRVVSGGGAPIRFVPAGAGRVRHYEEAIHRAGAVATREGAWHDLFNALAWLTFPRTKAALNRRHVAVAAHEPPSGRGAVRDVLTLFDEDGMIVASADATLDALLTGFCWKELFVARRTDARAKMRYLVFGHALHEKALAPFRGATGRAVILPVTDAFLALPAAMQIASLDERVAGRAAALAAPSGLAPLPILGVPGWWRANEDAAYYDDTGQFRPGRAGERRTAVVAAARVEKS